MTARINKILSQLAQRYKYVVMRFVNRLNQNFSRLTATEKKAMVIAFGTIVSLACLYIGYNTRSSIPTNNITKLNDSFMRNNKPLSGDQLIPLAKMKGEINGQFDSFYVAMDYKAQLFINRNIEHNSKAYERKNGWEEITRQELDMYARHLHVLPLGASTTKQNLKP